MPVHPLRERPITCCLGIGSVLVCTHSRLSIIGISKSLSPLI
ncbi:hypothetical protein [Collimonas sp. OK242]|nr:hypothetical protein [Collimonas sp. OK242]